MRRKSIAALLAVVAATAAGAGVVRGQPLAAGDRHSGRLSNSIRELPTGATPDRLVVATTYRASLIDPTPSLTPKVRGWAGVQFVSHQHGKVRYETAALFWQDPQHEVDLISGPAMTESPADTLAWPHSRNFNFAPYDPPTPVKRWIVAGRQAFYFDATAPPPGQWTLVGANPPEIGIEHDNAFRMAALNVRGKTFVIVIHGPVADFRQFLLVGVRLIESMTFPRQ